MSIVVLATVITALVGASGAMLAVLAGREAVRVGMSADEYQQSLVREGEKFVKTSGTTSHEGGM